MEGLITSPRNPRVKELRSLRLRKYREKRGQYLIEGIRIVEEALELGAPLETLIYSPDLLVSERARGLVGRVAAERRLALSGEVFRSLSDREEPQGIAASIRITQPGLEHLPVGADLLALVAYQVRDPGNLGSIVRTADAAGASGVIVVEPSADLYDAAAVRATMGSLYALPVVRLAGDAALTDWCALLRDLGLRLLVAATSAHGTRVHYDLDYTRPAVLLIGNERTGLPEDVRRAADALVRLPMLGRATSLNAAAAAAALVYEVVRQRRQAGLGRWADGADSEQRGTAR